MLRKLSTHISPASVLAMVALFVALGGVSYAATKITTKQLGNQSVTSLKIKNRTILKKDLRPKLVNSLKGKQGPAGPAGPQGAPGSALAYAQVADNGPSFVSARTSGFVALTRPAVGTYCLQPTPEVVAAAFGASGDPTRPTVASVEFGNTATQGNRLTVAPRGATVACPDNTFEVHTYRSGVAANSVAFTLIVP
jgi:hypothetical protein